MKLLPGTPAVEMRGVVRRFGGISALEGARLAAWSGEVHGVLGENGAGKTTLLSILAGLETADAGEVRVAGQPVRIRTPREAWARGIGMVHQHFSLVPRMTVLENLMLGHRGAGSGFRLPRDRIAVRAAELMESTGLDLPFDMPVERLGVGARQRAEILRVLLREPTVLVLDEPTAVLSLLEVDRLLALLRTWAAEGRAVLIVAHKLDEILEVADRVTVLRRGETVLEAPRATLDPLTLTRAMVGRPPAPPSPSTKRPRRERRSVAALSEVSGRFGEWPRAVSLEVRSGEIVAIAGVEGNGQRELARVLAGREAIGSGEARLPDRIGFVPQDREHEGLVGSFSVAENLALALQRDPAFRRGPFLRWAALERQAREALHSYGIVASGPAQRAGTLSGGNRQRVVVARELAGDPTLLVAENPTRGLDVTGERFVRDQLRALRDREVSPPGIVLLSTDLDEVVELADRVFVMVRGRLLRVAPGDDLRERAGIMMLTGEGP